MSRKNSLYHRSFSDMRGVDLSTREPSRRHFAALENMWRSPLDDTNALESVPGVRLCHRFAGAVRGLWRHKTREGEYLVLHAGDALYRFPVALRDKPNSLSALPPLMTGLPETRGCAFALEERLYLLIGGQYFYIDGDGAITELSEGSVYLPTTYINGEAYTQRNLLGQGVREIFSMDAGEYDATVGEEGLLFSVTSEEQKTCSVRISALAREAVRLRVPAVVRIGGEEYRVTAIAPQGFQGMQLLLSVSLPETLTAIGAGAFLGCTALSSVSLPSGVTTLGKRAFANCFSLKTVHLGAGLSGYAAPVFENCLSLIEVSFGGTEEQFAAIKEISGQATELLPEGVTLRYEEVESEDLSATYRFRLCEPCIRIKRVALGKTVLSENFTVYGDTMIRYGIGMTDGICEYVDVTVLDKRAVVGRQLTVIGECAPFVFPIPTVTGGYLTGSEAVLGCRLAAEYDGRIFLTGNPLLPSTVFFCGFHEEGGCEPFYFGVLDYFADGASHQPNAALLAVGSSLAVIKEEGGGLYFHTPTDSGAALIPRIYPATEGPRGLGTAGCAFHFKDDALFLSENGLYAIGRLTSYAERSLTLRSSRIGPLLRTLPLASARAESYMGYLFLLVGGTLLLADGRELTEGEYEWYPVTGVGGYTDDAPLYRYTDLPPSRAKEGYSCAMYVGEPARGEIHSVMGEGGELLYFSAEEDGKYLVDTDGERTGGSPSPATELCAVGDCLFFGTEAGHLLCFNADKYGKRLYRTEYSTLYCRQGEEYLPLAKGHGRPCTEDELVSLPLYRKTEDAWEPAGMGLVCLDGKEAGYAVPFADTPRRDELAAVYYSFAAHPYRSLCCFPSDDGGIPHYTKRTEPGSATVKLKHFSRGAFRVEIRTDKAPWQTVEERTASNTDFGEFDFAALEFHTERTAVTRLRDRTRRFCEKQYRFISEEYCRPFGICSLAYSYHIDGRIKS